MNNILRNIFFGLISGIILLLGMELFLRFGGIVDRSITDFDKKAGRVRPADHEFVMFNEGFGIDRFNEGRYLGSYVSENKGANEIRIAILGDSYAESFQVFARHKFYTRIPEHLTQEGNKKVEVMNFGRSGFDLEDMVAYREVIVNAYHPDLILYFLSNQDFFPSVTDELVPRVTVQGDSAVINRDFPEAYLKRYLLFNSFFSKSNYLNMINNCNKQINAGLLAPKLFGKFYRESNTEADEVSEIIVPVTESQQLPENAKELFENVLSDPRSIIVYRSREDILPAVQAFIDSMAVPFLDLRIPLESLADDGKDPEYWPVTSQYGHWNHAAHKAIGIYLGNELAKIIED